jgi:hypothetical protein
MKGIVLMGLAVLVIYFIALAVDRLIPVRKPRNSVR